MGSFWIWSGRVRLFGFWKNITLYSADNDKTNREGEISMNYHTRKPVIVKSILFNEKSNENGLELVTVIKVIDGDTFVVSDGRRVRLIGVDTPGVLLLD